MPTIEKDALRGGIIFAISAYTMWGIAPLYFRLIDHINADEILVHRVVWSTILLTLIVLLTKRWGNFIATITQPKIVMQLTISATFLAVNWFMFIWAVNNDHLLDASLGYYINPLFSVALGVVFLGERLRFWQLFAVGLAFIGVLIQLIMIGSLPIISLALAATFGTYGLLRKKMPLDSFVGLLIESLMMLPIALIYWLFFLQTTTTNMFENTMSLNTLLICTGIVTTAPLLCFSAATKRMTLTALGFFQYIGPSIMFVLATFYYEEPLYFAKLITFACIWTALAIFSFDSVKARRKAAKIAVI
ncbi:MULTISPECIES: EamA family transporter RarD [unclassified Colwellia]|jgi:chloramphenicol-sensitive protein RarD|uniref:EamA family transporter RarD n=1 Tax=unclassified Colwellia TaxID=196834 RepID=UPI000D3762B0|nr:MULTISPECIES: EamA family transporter RarD [unclassified Colwellia]AWB59241.1 EamA family transporter RarD [Colwellia sp. Arc7-D]MBA6415104.1 EamA family transporter RarD [Colwellia sp. 6M3]|tara:strand:- start:4988 stop:5899 length:912 start_codon:yes stop_codon:yes gene_type:complete